MENSFKIRAYSYCELALLYFPNCTKSSASTQLGRWVRQNELLKKELLLSGFKPRKKILTPNQVKILMHFLGEP